MSLPGLALRLLLGRPFRSLGGILLLALGLLGLAGSGPSVPLAGPALRPTLSALALLAAAALILLRPRGRRGFEALLRLVGARPRGILALGCLEGLFSGLGACLLAAALLLGAGAEAGKAGVAGGQAGLFPAPSLLAPCLLPPVSALLGLLAALPRARAPLAKALGSPDLPPRRPPRYNPA